MKIGFTGTQKRLTEEQKESLMCILKDKEINEFHHGDCIGADHQASFIARSMRILIVGHPPVDSSKRAFCPSDSTRSPKPYSQRNKDIVNETDRLVATPAQRTELLRSGTWSTVRYARKAGKPVLIIYPDGSVEGI